MLENTYWGTSKAREERKKTVGREGGSKEEKERETRRKRPILIDLYIAYCKIFSEFKKIKKKLL